ncbi:MAG: peptidylprolyl isomerase [Burkholderiaceae bacterium]|jgi:peptidyl-prolyl cis-trans isomerase C|nr:peptidylprolyl isomerase [Burkholderiaceae bacterium]
MKKQIATAAAAALLAFTALPVLAQNVAVVNGKPIPKARLDILENQIKQQAASMGRPVPPDMEKQLREKLIANEVLAQEAEREGIPATPEFRNQLDLMRQAVLINVLFANYLKQHPVSDAEAKAEYDRVVKGLAAQTGGKEYKASHILVKTEDQAKDIIAQLNKGAKFEDLAKKYSQDPGSATNGGELGWASPKTYVPEFADALTKLNKGQTTDAPVKTQYGYHIIRLEDTRDAKPQTPPPFDNVKPQIVEQLEQQKVAAFEKQLRDKAKVE